MLRWQDILHFEFLGNPVINWGLALITFLVTLTVLPIVKGFIAARRRSWSGTDRLRFHTAVELTAHRDHHCLPVLVPSGPVGHGFGALSH
jgi:hypothetical protein